MRVNLQALGCRLNEAELEQWATDFQQRGHEITSSADDADLLVINTCAVTGEAGRKSRQFIRRIQRNNPKAKLVVSGCYVTLEQQQAANIEGIDLVVTNQDKDRLVEHIHRELNLQARSIPGQWSAKTVLFQRGRSRAFIKVQDGCRWRCSYCIVTVARGEERSIPVEQVIRQINQYVVQGVKEIVLTGVHLGGYGSDMASDLYSLIQAVLKETDVKRIRLGSLEPWDIHEKFFSLFEDSRLMPHLHLPLQSGSDSVLRRMSRRCKTVDYAELIMMARQAIPDFNVTTDIIAGFPGETDEEWQAGYDFIESMGFGYIHVFSFSPRVGTKAAGFSDSVRPEVMKQRSRQLQGLANKMKQIFVLQQRGKTYQVLLEDKVEVLGHGKYRYSGYTPNYLRVEIASAKKSMSNTIIQYRF